jgi:hypothetical protein
MGDMIRKQGRKKTRFIKIALRDIYNGYVWLPVYDPFDKLQLIRRVIIRPEDVYIWGRVDMRGDLDLYDGDCHYRQEPFLGWLYYSLNLLLVVNPLRMPLSVAGNTMNTLSGAGSHTIHITT